jgi:hypothetical protein
MARVRKLKHQPDGRACYVHARVRVVCKKMERVSERKSAAQNRGSGRQRVLKRMQLPVDRRSRQRRRLGSTRLAVQVAFARTRWL